MATDAPFDLRRAGLVVRDAVNLLCVLDLLDCMAQHVQSLERYLSPLPPLLAPLELELWDAVQEDRPEKELRILVKANKRFKEDAREEWDQMGLAVDALLTIPSRFKSGVPDDGLADFYAEFSEQKRRLYENLRLVHNIIAGRFRALQAAAQAESDIAAAAIPAAEPAQSKSVAEEDSAPESLPPTLEADKEIPIVVAQTSSSEHHTVCGQDCQRSSLELVASARRKRRRRKSITTGRACAYAIREQEQDENARYADVLEKLRAPDIDSRVAVAKDFLATPALVFPDVSSGLRVARAVAIELAAVELNDAVIRLNRNGDEQCRQTRQTLRRQAQWGFTTAADLYRAASSAIGHADLAYRSLAQCHQRLLSSAEEEEDIGWTERPAREAVDHLRKLFPEAYEEGDAREHGLCIFTTCLGRLAQVLRGANPVAATEHYEELLRLPVPTASGDTHTAVQHDAISLRCTAIEAVGTSSLTAADFARAGTLFEEGVQLARVDDRWHGRAKGPDQCKFEKLGVRAWSAEERRLCKVLVIRKVQEASSRSKGIPVSEEQRAETSTLREELQRARAALQRLKEGAC